MKTAYNISEQVEYKVISKESVDLEKHIILYNDDVNSFAFVIETLIKICHHDLLQAEQCAYITHFKGKCSVMSGSFNTLKPMCEALLDRGLSAAIE